MSVRWMAVQYVGSTLRLPIVNEGDLDKPIGSSRLEVAVKRIEVRNADGERQAFVPESLISEKDAENANLKIAAERDADVLESLNLSLEESQAENAELKERVEWLEGECRKSMGASHKFFEMVGEYQKENTKLRELVRDIFEVIEDSRFDPCVERQGKRGPYYEDDPSWRVEIRERLRELGIEVD